MPRIRRTQIVASYVLSLIVVISLLVLWVVYVVQSGHRINELADRVGVTVGKVHWAVLIVGCALAILLIVELTSQLANTFAERRYSRKQEEFISNITHELKSPLAAIKLHAQTLERADITPEEMARSVGFILQQADRMSGLVDDVLESSRLVARKKLLTLEPVRLDTFFQDYFEEVRPRLEHQGLDLVSRIGTAATVLGSEDALRRLMDNLIENAARFSRTGGEVRSTVTSSDGRAVIEVEDDGVGIPKTELGKIFDRFYQVGPPGDGRRKGTGLGLSIVSGLVQEMGGSVHAFSQEGRPGTRFRIELPIAEATA